MRIGILLAAALAAGPGVARAQHAPEGAPHGAPHAPEAAPHAPDRAPHAPDAGTHASDPVHGAAAAAPAGHGDKGGHDAGGGHGNVDWWKFFYIQAVGFVLLLAVGWKFAWPGIRAGLDGRSRRLGEAFAKGDSEAREAERLLTEYQDRLRGFGLEAERRREAALRQGRALRAEMETEARGQARALVEKARAEAELERRRTAAEVRALVIARAFAAAEEALKSRMDDRAQAALVDRYVADLGKMPPI